MGRKANLTKEKRQSGVTLHNEGQRYRKIAKALNVSVNAVVITVKQFCETERNDDRPRTSTSESQVFETGECVHQK